MSPILKVTWALQINIEGMKKERYYRVSIILKEFQDSQVLVIRRVIANRIGRTILWEVRDSQSINLMPLMRYGVVLITMMSSMDSTI